MFFFTIFPKALLRVFEYLTLMIRMDKWPLKKSREDDLLTTEMVLRLMRERKYTKINHFPLDYDHDSSFHLLNSLPLT